MGISYYDYRYRINGLLATENTVFDNLQKLCDASGAWLTYDTHAGKWSVNINQAGDSAHSFDDSNIIGPINISGTGLNDLYNKVTVTFPHEDLRDQTDTVSIEIPDVDRNPNEPDNTKFIKYDIVTSPVQAQLLGFIELKQGRVDKVINFKTDYSKINVLAGDIIDVTNTIYGFVNKKFRVITVRELDTDSGSIDVEITALEYDETVYDTDDLSRFTVSNETGIVSIGNIAAPDQPTITLFSNIARPFMSIVTQVNSGLSNAVDFYITDDVPPGVTIDSNRTYTFLTTEFAGNGNVFTPGTEVRANVTYNNGNFLIKCRSKNDSAVSEFSTPSGAITYTPKQVTDTIGPNTDVRDGSGNLATTAGLLALLQIADEFFGGNAAVGPGGGSGSGSTFLLLKIQNQYLQSSWIEGNATLKTSLLSSYGGSFGNLVADQAGRQAWDILSDELQIHARIVPPTATPVIENADQPTLLHFVGVDHATGGGDEEAPVLRPISWPPHYYNKMMYYFKDDINVPFKTGNITLASLGDVIGVDLGVYRYYYPDATDITVEVRGYWKKKFDEASGPVLSGISVDKQSIGAQFAGNLANLVTGGNVTTSTTMPLADIQTYLPAFNVYGTGTGDPIRVRAQIYTGANALISVAGLSNAASYDVPYTVAGNVFANVVINPVGSWDSNGVGFSSNVVVTSSVDYIDKGVARNIPGDLICNFHYDFTEPAVSAPSFNALDINTIQSNVLIPNTWTFTRDLFDNITGITANTYVTANASSTLANVLGWTRQANLGIYGNGVQWIQWSDSNVAGTRKNNTTVGLPVTANIFTIANAISYPGQFEVTQDQIDNDDPVGVVSTSHVWVDLSDIQTGPQTTSHVFIPKYLTQLDANGNVKYGFNVLPGPDSGHLDGGSGFNEYYYGAFDGNANVPTPITGNLQSNSGAAFTNGFGAWVDGTLSS